MSHFTRYKTPRTLLHSIAFEPVEALDDGLGDEIVAEQQEQGITLEETPDVGSLQDFWNQAVEDARKDPNWNFTNDEDNAPLY